jgi:hypothetical protein
LPSIIPRAGRFISFGLLLKVQLFSLLLFIFFGAKTIFEVRLRVAVQAVSESAKIDVATMLIIFLFMIFDKYYGEENLRFL